MNTQLQTSSNVAFEFVRTLAGELSGGHVDLPAFPEIAIRVRRVLSDPKASIDQVVRVVGSEPVLTARLLRISNSASLNRSGRAVNDLRTAINRIGYNMVRSAAIAFALAQVRKSNRVAGLERHLRELWQRSTLVAAFAYVLARTCSRVNPDEAMLTGMMHGIGELYILTRTIDHPELPLHGPRFDDIVGEWHAPIGKAILENWGFSEATAAAVGEQHDLGREDAGPADLRDIIAIARLMAAHSPDYGGLLSALNGLPASLRLELDGAKTLAMIEQSAGELTALREALGTA